MEENKLVKREKDIIKTSLVGIGGNVLLVVGKIIVGVFARSISIITDAVNNLTDALSSVVTIIGTKISNKRPDKKHPYGHGRVEFITTDTYVNKYLKESSKILEVGAGTGRYSLYYAKKGYDVTSVEFVKHNLDVLKSHIEEGMNINAMQGDATNLDMLEDNTFDITLVLGPLYHLYTEEDVDKAIKEAIRVTKPGGVIAFAYLTHDSIMVDWALMGDHLVDRYLISFDENFKMIIDPKEVFTAFYTFEFKKMMEKYNIDFLHNIATDGMTHHVKEKIDVFR